MKTYTKDEIQKLIKKAEHEMWKVTNEMNSIAYDEDKEMLTPDDMLKIFIERLLRNIED